jgi:hypothetical protein
VEGDHGLAADAPLLAGLGAPRASLRPWFRSLLTTAAARDGALHVVGWLRLLSAAATDRPSRVDAAPELFGAGCAGDPWRVAFDPTGAFCGWLWLEPAPASPGLAGALVRAADSSSALARATVLARPLVPALLEALEELEDARFASGIDALAALFSAGDGVVPVESQAPEGFTRTEVVSATHATAPIAGAAKVLGEIGGDVALLLSAPFADATSWAGVIGGASSATFDLRQAGIPPEQVDLRAVTGTPSFYVADLAGTDVASLTAQIVRILDYLDGSRPGVRVALVAHSVTGRGAVAAATQRASLVTKVITIGTPHLGAAPPYLEETPTGVAAKIARALVPPTSTAAIRPAIDLVAAIVEGVAPPGATSAVPTRSLAEATPTPLPTGVPLVAVPVVVGAALVADLAAGLRTAVPSPPPDPTAARFAVSARLGEPAPVGEVDVATEIVLDLARVGLSDATLDSSARRLRVVVRMERIDGWILGGAGTQPDGTPWPARVRRARLECTWDGATLDTQIELADAGLASGATRTVGLDAPDAASLLDALFASLADRASAAPLMQSLDALGLLVPGTRRLAADALAALRSDGAAYLAPRLRAALGGTRLYGADPHAGWTVGPLTVVPDTNGLSVTVEHALLTAGVRVDARPLSLGGTATWHVGPLALTWAPGTLDLIGSPWLDPVRLVPAGTDPTPPHLVERIAFSVAADAVIRRLLSISAPLPPLDAVLLGRIDFASAAVSAPLISSWLGHLAAVMGLPPRDDGLFIPPAGLLFSVVESADHRFELRLRTETSIGGVLDVTAALRLGPGLAVEPAATLALHVPDLPGAGGAAWRDVHLDLGVSAHGASLGLTVGTAGTVGSPSGQGAVTFLPTFSGWGSLIAIGVALLPHALDEITQRVADSTIKTAVLDVAAAFRLYGPNFSTHVSDFQAISSWTFDETIRARTVAAIAALLPLAGVPGTILTPTGARLTWTAPPFLAPVAGTLGVTLDWTAPVPTLEVTGAVDVTLNTGGSALDHVAFLLGLDVRVAEDFHATASVGLDRPLGTNVVPRLELGVRRTSTGAEPLLRVLPLATSAAEGPLVLTLAPTPAATVDDAALPGSIGFDVLLPLLTAVLERATGSATLWPGGPTIPTLVDATHLFDADHRLRTPIPDVPSVLAGLTTAMSANVTIGPLTLTIGGLDGGRVGVAATGLIRIPIDSVELDVLFGDTEGTEVHRTEVVLFRNDGGGVTFAPALHADHFGVGVRGSHGNALVSTDHFRLGGIEAFVDFGLELGDAGVTAELDGVGAALDELGISLGSATGSGNAVASGLMRNTSSSGDGTPAQPPFGVSVEYRRGGGEEEADEGGGAFELDVRLHGDDERRTWIGIHASFGPLYIDQVGVELEKNVDPSWIRLLVDGGVSLAGFTAQVDDLALQIPTHHLDDPTRWGVDLASLAIAYSGGGVSLVGGLQKHELDPPGTGVEYVGMLELRLQNLGAVAVGQWSKQQDAQGELDSLFAFAAVFVTLTFPPYFELQALGAGFGYNGALVVPEHVEDVPQFVLVSVLDDPSVVNRPMDVLETLRMPARRGSFWFAAGMRGAVFTVIDVVAVLYVSLDRNFEIGILGVGRLAQPQGSPIVTIELALKVRYSDAEGALSIQAQLTDNSWLFIPDCALTGGFALSVWFRTGKFVVTIGGYHPSFQPPPEFPVVPRLGFRCDLASVIHLKGEAYFALTSSCVMAGVRLEAAYDVGWLRAWFRAWADFLLAWDPFHYEISIGIELGADFNFDTDLLVGTVSVHFSVSVGASLDIVGPPLHGEVHANLGPLSITVPFGDDRPPTPPPLSWDQFRDRYVLSGDETAAAVAVVPGTGAVPPSSGATPPQGLTAQDPWRFTSEFSLRTTTAMAASSIAGPVGGANAVWGADVDLAPMGAAAVHVTSTHRLSLTHAKGQAITELRADRWEIVQDVGKFAAAIWRHRESPDPNAEVVAAGAGMEARTVAGALHASASIPISTLVDVGDPLPLPFVAQDARWRTTTIDLGNAAIGFAGAFATADALGLLSPVTPARAGLGVGGVEGSARRAVRKRRSPPLIAALSEGMDLSAVGRGVAPAPKPPPQQPPEHTTPALLHASLGAVPPTAPPLVATTAAKSGANLLRTKPPAPKATLGTMALLPDAAPATAIAAPAAALPRGPAGRKAIASTEAQALGGGVEVPAGAVQVWGVPARVRSVSLRGDGWRLVALGRAGAVLLDVECAGERRIALPKRTERVAVWSLGKSASPIATPARGAITFAQSNAPPITVGWHSGSRVFVVGRFCALCRGGSLRLSAALPDDRGDGLGLRPVSRFLGDQPTIETTLPRRVTALLVLASAPDPTQAALGDLDVRVDGGTIGPPLPFEGVSGEGALYAVHAKDDLRVTVASMAGYRPRAVVGFRGAPAEIAAWLHTESRTDVVAEGPLSVDGSVGVSFSKGDA